MPLFAKKPKQFEAMFPEETERGPFRLNEKLFEPGKWIAVEAGEAEYLRAFGDRVTIREVG